MNTQDKLLKLNNSSDFMESISEVATCIPQLRSCIAEGRIGTAALHDFAIRAVAIALMSEELIEAEETREGIEEDE